MRGAERPCRTPLNRLVHAYRHLLDLVRVGDADAAEAHWRKHLDSNLKLMPHRVSTIRVRDNID
jgi:GntR family transcriptional regulator, transcriptional repressor for pyruvate dehydrogenase complex